MTITSAISPNLAKYSFSPSAKKVVRIQNKNLYSCTRICLNNRESTTWLDSCYFVHMDESETVKWAVDAADCEYLHWLAVGLSWEINCLLTGTLPTNWLYSPESSKSAAEHSRVVACRENTSQHSPLSCQIAGHPTVSIDWHKNTVIKVLSFFLLNSGF